MSFFKHHIQINFSRKEILIMLLSIVSSMFFYSQTLASENTNQTPIIIVKGETEFTIEVGDNYTDEGVIAYDYQQGFITQYITILGSVDISTPGIYVLIYNVRDEDWNYAETKTRKVTVVGEAISTNKPEIESYSIGELDGDIVKISFETNEVTQAVIGYGLNGEYTMFTTPEESFTYASHSQPLSKIESGKTYSYIIYVKNQQGESNSIRDTFTVGSINSQSSPYGENEQGWSYCGSSNKTSGTWDNLRNYGDGSIEGACIVGNTTSNQGSTPEILSHKTINITSNSAKINFVTNEKTKAYVLYGEGTNLNTSTTREESFNYDEHNQTLYNLKAGTKYNYKIYVTNAAGNTLTNDGNFTTQGGSSSSSSSSSSSTSSLKTVVNLNSSLISQGSWKEQDWKNIMGLDTAWTPIGMQHLSLINDGGEYKIRQRHQAASKGSDRVIAPMELKSLANRIKVKQTIEVAPNYTWGTLSESGKLGFGVGGGTNTSGGKVSPTGFTLRISWNDGGELDLYSYAADRQSGNHDYGEEISTGYFIQPGVPFDIEYELQMNSSASARDGWLKAWVNGGQVIDETGIGWMTAGDPKINRILWSEFHGGANSNWSPKETTWAQVSNISYETN